MNSCCTAMDRFLEKYHQVFSGADKSIKGYLKIDPSKWKDLRAAASEAIREPVDWRDNRYQEKLLMVDHVIQLSKRFLAMNQIPWHNPRGSAERKA